MNGHASIGHAKNASSLVIAFNIFSCKGRWALLLESKSQEVSPKNKSNFVYLYISLRINNMYSTLGACHSMPHHYPLLKCPFGGASLVPVLQILCWHP